MVRPFAASCHVMRDSLTVSRAEPVKTRLVSLEAALTILKLSLSIYPPGSWLRPAKPLVNGQDDGSPSHLEEVWTLRTGLSQWAWRAISELRNDDEENSTSASIPCSGVE